MPTLSVIPLTGMPQVRTGDDLAALVVAAAAALGVTLAEGDLVVVSSKVVSKARGLWADAADRDDVVRSQSRRVVAERRSAERVTRIVESVAGPVMAAAGVDASNTGAHDGVLLLPPDPDGEADRLRRSLLDLTGLRRLGLVLSDTAGRPWRAGQVDFALGASGVAVLDDLRGGLDADGRPLSVTARALADELAAMADLVKGKADGVPVAVVRGTPWALSDHGDGAASLVRVGATDWFDLGRAEAVRAALGTVPGTPEAEEVGIPAVAPEERSVRVGRAVAVALRACPGAAVDTGGDVVHVAAQTPYELGLAAARLAVALWGEGVSTEVPAEADGLSVTLHLTDR